MPPNNEMEAWTMKRKAARRLARGFYRDLRKMIAERNDKWEREQNYCKQCFFVAKVATRD